MLITAGSLLTAFFVSDSLECILPTSNLILFFLLTFLVAAAKAHEDTVFA